MWKAGLLGHQVLYLAYCIVVQQTVLVSNRQTQWLGDWFEIARDSNQRWVACVGSIDLSVRGQDSIPSSPAESNSSNLSSAWDCAHVGDELVDEGLRDRFAVLNQPWWQSCSNSGSGFRLVDESLMLPCFERGFDALEKVEGDGISLMNIGYIAVEACLGIVVGK